MDYIGKGASRAYPNEVHAWGRITHGDINKPWSAVFDEDLNKWAVYTSGGPGFGDLIRTHLEKETT